MLETRIFTAAALLAGLLAALYLLPDAWWAGLLLAVVLLGAREWAALAGYGRAAGAAYLALTLAIGLVLMPWQVGDLMLKVSAALICAATLFWLVLAPLWLARGWRITGKWHSAPLGWLVLLPPWLALIQLRHIGAGVVLALLATVWVADSAAYFFGKRYGRRKLAPEISPGKTWAGFWGALATVLLLSVAICLWQDWSFWFVAGLLAIAVLSVIGDLFESMIKRQAGRKDSGTLLPGHGGVLDRIDGLTSTLPLAAFFAYFPMYFSQLAA